MCVRACVRAYVCVRARAHVCVLLLLLLLVVVVWFGLVCLFGLFSAFDLLLLFCYQVFCYCCGCYYFILFSLD